MNTAFDQGAHNMGNTQRMQVYGIVFVGLLLTSPLHAQGQSQYCAQFYDGSPPNCGFSSLQMCERSVTGVGGICSLNPSQPATTPQNQMPFNSSAVPPPPFAQQPSSAASAESVSQINSLSNDLAIGGDPPATLGAITLSAGHNACIGLFGSSSCGGS
jgi:uncharacterized protein DUF3551